MKKILIISLLNCFFISTFTFAAEKGKGFIKMFSCSVSNNSDSYWIFIGTNLWLNIIQGRNEKGRGLIVQNNIKSELYNLTQGSALVVDTVNASLNNQTREITLTFKSDDIKGKAKLKYLGRNRGFSVDSDLILLKRRNYGNGHIEVRETKLIDCLWVED